MTSEFYLRIERPTVVSILRRLKPSRVLDLGCGTGVWTKVVSDLYPHAARILGVDKNHSMIAFGRRAFVHAMRLHACDALRYVCEIKYDLVMLPMSVDHIGAEESALAIARNLSSEGRALIWFLDSAKYSKQGEYRIKGWTMGGLRVVARVGDCSPTRVVRELARAGLSSCLFSVPFTLKDGRDRILHIIEVTRRECHVS